MATIKNSTVNDIGFLRLPAGTTAERPANPSAGMVRYNTSLGYAEVFNGYNWVKFGLR